MNRRSWVVIVFLAIAASAIAITLRISGEDSIEGSPTTTIAQASTPPSAFAPGTTVCDRYQSPTTTGAVESAAVFETSGIAASRRAPGVIWAHNDSGSEPTVYAIGPNGEDLGSFTVGGGLAFDWEDLAIGPGPEDGRSYLYIGDIGDNLGIRDGRITVYRLAEPDSAALPASVPIEDSFDLATLDGAHNFEALFVADDSIFVATKDMETTQVYRTSSMDAPAGSSLELIATIDLGAEVTAADVSWDGSTIAFRGYETIWMWHRGPTMTVAETLASVPCTAPSAIEEQGEALAFLDDSSVVTISEGEHPDIHRIPRAP